MTDAPDPTANSECSCRDRRHRPKYLRHAGARGRRRSVRRAPRAYATRASSRPWRPSSARSARTSPAHAAPRAGPSPVQTSTCSPTTKVARGAARRARPAQRRSGDRHPAGQAGGRRPAEARLRAPRRGIKVSPFPGAARSPKPGAAVLPHARRSHEPRGHRGARRRDRRGHRGRPLRPRPGRRAAGRGGHRGHRRLAGPGCRNRPCRAPRRTHADGGRRAHRRTHAVGSEAPRRLIAHCADTLSEHAGPARSCSRRSSSGRTRHRADVRGGRGRTWMRPPARAERSLMGAPMRRIERS